MARVAYKRRYYRKPRSLALRKVRRYAGRGQYMLRRIPVMNTKKGFIKLFRKLPEIYAVNGPGPGQLNAIDPTGTCLNLGSPILDPNGTTWSIPFSMKFQLKQIINSADVSNLCDAYKLKYASVKLSCQHNTASQTSIGLLPTITWIQDHDDNTLPASIDALREKMGVKTAVFGMKQTMKIGVQPRCAEAIYNGLTSTAYAIPRAKWLNSSYPAVDHYAIKGFISNVLLPTTTQSTVQFKFDVTTLVYGKDFQ